MTQGIGNSAARWATMAPSQWRSGSDDIIREDSLSRYVVIRREWREEIVVSSRWLPERNKALPVTNVNANFARRGCSLTASQI